MKFQLIILSLCLNQVFTQLIKIPIIEQSESISTLEKRQNIPSVALYNANSRQYLIEIGIGTPTQYFNLTLDTGSSDLWVASTSCTKSNCPQRKFDRSKSKTFKSSTGQFSVQYGSGSAKGTIGHDTVTLKKNTTSVNQVLGLATETEGITNSNGLTSSEQASGILGLAFPALLKDPTEKTWIEKLVENKVIAEPVFSIYLNKQSNYGYQGEIVLGGYETSRLSGSLKFLPVIGYDQEGKANSGSNYQEDKPIIYKYWTVPGQSISGHAEGKKIFEAKFSDIQPVVLDTGTTLSYLPKDTLIDMLDLITTNYTALTLNQGEIQAYQVNCKEFLRQEDMYFQFAFSSNIQKTSKKPVTIRVPLSELLLPQESKDVKKSKTCLFGIAPVSNNFLSLTDTSGWIIGQTILRSSYVVHDMYGLQIGLGEANNGYSISGTNDNNSSYRVSLKVLLFFNFFIVLFSLL